MGDSVLHRRGPWFGICYLSIVRKQMGLQSFKIKLKTMLIEQEEIFELKFLQFFFNFVCILCSNDLYLV